MDNDKPKRGLGQMNIRPELKKELDKLRTHPRDSYSMIIEKLINCWYDSKDRILESNSELQIPPTGHSSVMGENNVQSEPNNQ
jgi:hypothetical protein